MYARLAVLLAGLVLLASSHWKAYTSGRDNVQAEWNVEKLEVAKQSLKVSEQAARDTATLQLNAETIRRNKNAAIAKLNTDLADALNGLRDRPPRPGKGDLPAPAGTGAAATGCTGKELYRADSELLTRTAASADELRTSLKQCYAQYEAARAALNQR